MDSTTENINKHVEQAVIPIPYLKAIRTKSMATIAILKMEKFDVATTAMTVSRSETFFFINAQHTSDSE